MDLIILDVMMPIWTLLQSHDGPREMSELPIIIMLTAKSAEDE